MKQLKKKTRKDKETEATGKSRPGLAKELNSMKIEPLGKSFTYRSR